MQQLLTGRTRLPGFDDALDADVRLGDHVDLPDGQATVACATR